MSNRSLQGRWGFAADAAIPTTDARGTSLRSWLSTGLVILIEIYRRLISPLLGPNCRFHPTCSQYAIEAINRYGPLGGSARALARLARCHPLCEGGHDPVR